MLRDGCDLNLLWEVDDLSESQAAVNFGAEDPAKNDMTPSSWLIVVKL